MIAYLDANSGSLIASAIAAGFAGIAVVFKMGWSRTLGFFSPKKRRAAKEAMPRPRHGRGARRRDQRPLQSAADPTPVAAGDDA